MKKYHLLAVCFISALLFAVFPSAQAGTPIVTNTVTVVATPAGVGIVSGGGKYRKGTSVSVYAQATNDCYQFVRWTSGHTVLSTNGTYGFTNTANITLVANFALIPFKITTLNSPANGGTSVGGGIKNCGSSFTVTAVPNTKAGYAFLGWSYDNANTTNLFSYDTSTSITADSPLVLYANFIPGFTVSATSAPADAGTITGAHAWANNATATLTATPDSCHTFVRWIVNGKTYFSNAVYQPVITKNLSLVAVFAQKTYEISTISLPSKGGITSGGGLKACGSEAQVVAKAAPGFKFVFWNTGSLNPIYAFPVSGEEQLVAEFEDIQPPTLKVIAPSPGEKTSSTAFTISGTAVDNVAVQMVSYSLNGTGNVCATTTNGWTNWFAPISLQPDYTNILVVKATDTTGNSTTTTIKVDCTAAGYAPDSLAGMDGTFTLTNGVVYDLSFDPASMSQSSNDTNDLFNAGAYTYTLTDRNLAQLNLTSEALPGSGNGANLSLTFTDAYNATFMDGDGNSGSATFAPQPNIVPPDISGATITARSSTQAGYIGTLVFKDGTFTGTDNQDSTTTTGTYTSSQVSPDSRLIVMIYTSPADHIGDTNYVLATFSPESDGPQIASVSENAGGDYFLASYSNSETNADYGSFTISFATSSTKYIAPASLSGMLATVLPAGQPSMTVSFGDATFGQSTPNTNDAGGVGFYEYTRLGASTAQLTLHRYNLDWNEKTDAILLHFSSAHGATFSEAGKTNSGSLTLSPATTFVPPLLTDRTITTLSGGKRSTYVFSYGGLFVTTPSKSFNADYTYASYSPTIALIESTDADSTSNLVVLTFTSASGGTFVSASTDDSGTTATIGTFTLAPTIGNP